MNEAAVNGAHHQGELPQELSLAQRMKDAAGDIAWYLDKAKLTYGEGATALCMVIASGLFDLIESKSPEEQERLTQKACDTLGKSVRSLVEVYRAIEGMRKQEVANG